MRVGRVISSILDVFGVVVSGIATAIVMLLRRTASETSGAPRLLVLDASYSLRTVRRRGLMRSIEARDLEGYFEHVWSVNPLVGAGPDDADDATGSLVISDVGPRHTIVEARVSRFRGLRRLPATNMAISQCALLLALDRLIADRGIAAIRAGDPYYLGLLGYLLGRRHHIPLVVRVSGNYDALYAATGQLAYPRLLRKRWIEKRIDRFVLQRAELVAAPNEDNLGYALANGARPERAAIFRYGNLVHPIHFEDPSTRLRPDDLPPDRKLMMCIGRLEPVKHPEDVLRTAERVIERVPDVTAVLVGDGSLREVLERKAREALPPEAVVFTGNKDQGWLAAAMTHASVIFAPMAGRALVEAALSGTPVVAYDVDWHSELVSDGHTGALVAFGDVGAAARAVIRVLEDPELTGAMGRTARDAALEMMDPATLAEVERDAYDAVFSRWTA